MTSSKKWTEADLAGALHDVSNALTVLLGWAEEASAVDASPEAIRYALSVIADEARRARNLARRTIGGSAEMESDALDGVVDRVVSALSVEAHKRGLRIERQGKAPEASAEGSAVAQIAVNLLLNAMAYSPRGGAVRIRTSETEDDVSVDVEDDGPGVPAERRDSIFEGDSTRVGGTGVGLRHARDLARSLGGDLMLLISPRSGASFRLTWPKIPPAPVSFASVVPPPTLSVRAGSLLLGGTRVLVVEDDPAVTGLLEVALEARGAMVTLASSVEEVFAAAGDQDAILVDLSPIAGNVEQAVAMLRSKSPRARFIVTTGSVDSVPDVLFGARVVRKPFEVGEIVTAIAEAD
ncbi:MAG: sensor histidine kinase [Polyangiaceae bacterium]|nr:sensor histidine kinase [Polyangiaceae bacterium]